MISGVDCWPKAMPLGYGLEGLSARIDCVRGDCWPKAMPLGYVLLGLSARIDCVGCEFCICENI